MCITTPRFVKGTVYSSTLLDLDNASLIVFLIFVNRMKQEKLFSYLFRKFGKFCIIRTLKIMRGDVTFVVIEKFIHA